MNLDYDKKRTIHFLLVLGIIVTAAFFLVPKDAFAVEQLTDLFDSTAFSGSMNVIKKFNWLGKLLNFIISAFSLLGLFLICYQRLITLLYLAGRNTFDNVYEIKEAGKGQAFFGMKPIIGNTWNAQYGTGLDAFVGFLLSLLPNVKAYSDYNPSNMPYNLNEDDSCTTYMLKVAIPTIMLVFFFAIGFNGTLWNAYGNVVDAMAYAADQVVGVNLTVIVDKVMNSGSNQKFYYEDDGTEWGSFRQGIAEDLNKAVLKKCDDLSTDNKIAIATAISNVIDSELGDMQKFYSEMGAGDSEDSDAKKYSATVCINNNQSMEGFKGKQINIDSSSLGLEPSSKVGQYAHILISRNKKTDETDYWAPIGDSTGSSTNNSKPTQTTQED